LTKQVAVVVSNYTIDNSPSIINFLEFLRENNQVDLYYSNVSHCDCLKKMKNVRAIHIENKVTKLFFRLFSNKHDVYICFEPHGFRLCKMLFPESKPFYYSLELYMKDDHFGLDYPVWLMNWERANINQISGLFIQSEEKFMLFQKDYKLAESIPSYILPVTGKGKTVPEKSDYLHTKYNIPRSKNIALHLGGIADWFSCKEIAREFEKSGNWIVFFHGFPARDYYLEMVNEFSDSPNVILSQEERGDISGLDKIISSCKIGIAWYNDISIGFRTAGRSSGKIAAYMQFGLPVIAKRYSSTVGAIEETNAGVCVDNISELASAINKISGNYDSFSQSVLREYDSSYCFDKYEDSLKVFLGV